jgi:Zn-dependent peptidase ImmA (M78 family)/transcriptional regulator with XRE-family HTH domain
VAVSLEYASTSPHLDVGSSCHRGSAGGPMSVRISVQPTLLTWARERSRIPLEEVTKRFPAFDDWETGRKQPTLKQLERFATSMHAPIGYFFLDEPPEESLPVPDFRTMGDVPVGHASPDLLETIYQCQQRQEWYRDYARIQKDPEVAFVGSLNLGMGVTYAAEQINSVFPFSPSQRGSNWSEALSHLVDLADRLGVLVMVSGVVGSNTHRVLDPQEFRGFALSDALAPVIFINGADTKAAQIFTLAHELVHIGLGDSGVDDVDMSAQTNNASERWCNAVAAEFLIPAALLRVLNFDRNNLTEELQRAARKFKVSTLVVLRRLFDEDFFPLAQFRKAYAEERNRILAILESRSSGGGNFYNTQPLRVSKRFARAIIESTQEGYTLHRDAFHMLGFKKIKTFNEMSIHLGASDDVSA